MVLFFHGLSPTSSDLFLAFVRSFQAEDKVMRLFNAHRPSGLGHAMEPVLKKGRRVSTIRRTEAAYNSMSDRTWESIEVFLLTQLSAPGVRAIWKIRGDTYKREFALFSLSFHGCPQFN